MTEAAMSSSAPAKASLAAETTPATATPVKRLVPTAITLLLRDDGTLVLRAESPDAVDGFYNVDRDESALEDAQARPGTRAAAWGPVH